MNGLLSDFSFFIKSVEVYDKFYPSLSVPEHIVPKNDLLARVHVLKCRPQKHDLKSLFLKTFLK